MPSSAGKKKDVRDAVRVRPRQRQVAGADDLVRGLRNVERARADEVGEVERAGASPGGLDDNDVTQVAAGEKKRVRALTAVQRGRRGRVFVVMARVPPGSPLFPYTALFR